MNWIVTDSCSARIGGIIYRNVRCPIAINGKCVIQLLRHSEDGQLGATFNLYREDGTPLASVLNNTITGFDPTVYQLLQGHNRSALLERGTGRIWCEITRPQLSADYELDVSCILCVRPGYFVILHPDRSKFGIAKPNQRPTIFLGGTVTNNPERSATGAFSLGARPFYMLDVAIENFDVGVNITL